MSAKWEEKKQARNLMEWLKTEGHSITFDWTATKETDELSQSAIDDLNGVKGCDALIILANNSQYIYKGLWVEMGVALTGDKPILLLGNDTSNGCVFVHHPLVKQFKDIWDLKEYILFYLKEPETLIDVSVRIPPEKTRILKGAL